jgi:hypothetical protein
MERKQITDESYSDASVAQLGEQRAFTPKRAGSSPAGGTRDSWGRWYEEKEARLHAGREEPARYFDICTGRMELCRRTGL